MGVELQPLVAALLESKHFDSAAEATLRVMLQVAGEALAASRYAGSGRLLRGLIHLRPGEAYRGLAVVELPDTPGASRKAVEGVPLRASATAWRLVVEHHCAISIDIAQGTLRPHRSPTSKRETGLVDGSSGRFSSSESRQHFLGRQATHVCVLPLRSPGGGIDGMISLEASCMAALGQEFIWRDCEERLQLIADVAAPFLGSLPLRPIGPPAGDEFLPVIGSTMSRLLPILRVFAQENETLLISGPTGAGKSRLARWCHEHSPRRQGPFEVLDLMTVPEELQMAELFGWKKGAFTGAARDSPGSVTRAEGGTLFIMGRVSGRRTSVSSSAPMPTSSRPSRRSASERTSTTASMSSPSPCLRSTSARTRSPSGRTTWPFAGTASASRRGVCG